MVENLQPPFPSGSFDRIRGIGNVLQFPEDELGNEEWALDKAGLGDVCDPTVDDDAGIENLGIFSPGQASWEWFPSGDMKFISFLEADPDADITADSVKETVERKNHLCVIEKIGEKGVGN
jgi:hypothetical protein